MKNHLFRVSLQINPHILLHIFPCQAFIQFFRETRYTKKPCFHFHNSKMEIHKSPILNILKNIFHTFYVLLANYVNNLAFACILNILGTIHVSQPHNQLESLIL